MKATTPTLSTQESDEIQEPDRFLRCPSGYRCFCECLRLPAGESGVDLHLESNRHCIVGHLNKLDSDTYDSGGG